MQKAQYKRFNGKDVFTDFKHHAKSWSNSKHMRAKRTRQALKAQMVNQSYSYLYENCTSIFE